MVQSRLKKESQMTVVKAFGLAVLLSVIAITIVYENKIIF